MNVDAIIDDILADFTPDERRVLRSDIDALRSIVSNLAEKRECVTCPECPTYCGDERGYQTTIGRMNAYVGRKTEVFYPLSGTEGGKSGLGVLDAVYALVPTSQVVPSHDPQSFRESKAYPRELQERAYDRDKLEQQKVIRQAETLKPELVINSNPDAVNGPPIIDDRGYVLGGNSRTMSIMRVIAEGGGNPYTHALRQSIDEYGAIFGLALSPTDGMVLVRIVVGTFDAVRVSRDLNRSLTQGISISAEAVSLGRLLPPRLFATLGDSMFGAGVDSTLNSALNSNSREVVRILQDAQVITSQNYGRFTVSRKGETTLSLSSTGRQIIRDAIVGALVADKEYMTLLSPAQERLLEYIATPCMVLDTDDPSNERGFNLTGAIRPAIAMLTNRPTTRLDTFEDQFRTGELGFEKESASTLEQRYPEFFADPLAAIMAKWLVEGLNRPRVAFLALRMYVQGTPEHAQKSLFPSTESPEQLRIRSLGADFRAGKVTMDEVTSMGVMNWLAKPL